MGFMKTLALSSKELKSILDRLTALESGETFVTSEQFTEKFSEEMETALTQKEIVTETKLLEKMKANFPVGTIIETTNNDNPANYMGFGTWEAWGAGRVTVGVNTSDSSFDTVEKTGGEKEHKLIISEMPKHVHPFDSALSLQDSTDTGALSGTGVFAFSNIGSVSGTFEVGGDTAHNNLQPYITCYKWKRTA